MEETIDVTTDRWPPDSPEVVRARISLHPVNGGRSPGSQGSRRGGDVSRNAYWRKEKILRVGATRKNKARCSSSLSEWAVV